MAGSLTAVIAAMAIRLATATSHVRCTSALIQGAIDIAGLNAPHYLAGSGGRTKGDRVNIGHNSGLTLFSDCEEDWEPDSIAQLRLLGRTISMTVDLSEVGCACNLAFYLVSSPARDWDGKLSPGTDRGGQPPFYCDANQVGGQWCPEVDIMEANNHAFQSTAHKCDQPVNGHYFNCDRAGCSKSTRDRQGSYGPGAHYTIDTRRPFQVETDFPEKDGVLLGMRTVLRQGDRDVDLAHDSCDPEYLAALGAAMKDGMSLRITYWGADAETMAWMDSPPCGPQQCSGDNAGAAVISNITVSPAHDLKYYRSRGWRQVTTTTSGNPWWSPTSTTAAPAVTGNQWWSPVTTPGAAGGASETWAVSDETDPLNGQLVPTDIVADASRFAHMGDYGLAQWRGVVHFVKMAVAGGQPSSSGGKEEVFMRKYVTAAGAGAAARSTAGTLASADATAVGAIATAVGLSITLAAAVVALRNRRRRRSASSAALFVDVASIGDSPASGTGRTPILRRNRLLGVSSAASPAAAVPKNVPGHPRTVAAAGAADMRSPCFFPGSPRP